MPQGYGAVGYLWGLMMPVQRLPGSIARTVDWCIVRAQPRDKARGSPRSRTEATRSHQGHAGYIGRLAPFALRCVFTSTAEAALLYFNGTSERPV